MFSLQPLTNILPSFSEWGDFSCLLVVLLLDADSRRDDLSLPSASPQTSASSVLLRATLGEVGPCRVERGREGTDDKARGWKGQRAEWAGL